jgi:hypothetical protein
MRRGKKVLLKHPLILARELPEAQASSYHQVKKAMI